MVEVFKGEDYVRIKLTDFPENDFVTNTSCFPLRNAIDLIDEINKGDTLDIIVSKEEYHLKIIKDKNLRFSQKVFYSADVRAWAVSSSQKTYLTTENVNEYILERTSSGKFVIYGMFIFMVTLVLLSETGVLRKLVSRIRNLKTIQDK